MNKEVVLILGASSDIGCALIREIASNQNVILASYNKSPERLAELAGENGRTIVPIQADLSSEAQVKDLIESVRKGYGCPVKIVHLAAAKYENVRFKDISWERIQADIDIQVRSIVLILKEFLPRMAALGKHCKVVLMLSSCTMNVPPKYLSHYVTVKYALLGLMKAVAAEYANKCVNINAVSPSMIETRFLENVPPKIAEMNAAAVPFQRNATTRDIVPMIRFLLSEGADYMTGVNVPITGGSIF